MDGQEPQNINNNANGFVPNPEMAPTPESAPELNEMSAPMAETPAAPMQFTGNVSATPGMAATAPEKKKKTGLIIGLIVGLAVIVVGIVLAVILLAKPNETKTDSGTSDTEKPKEEKKSEVTLSPQAEARNLQREDDMRRIAVSVNDYVMNNDVTPFGNGVYDKAVLGKFVSRYIDANIDNSGAKEGESFKCKSTSCTMFSDPDGTIYGFTVDKAKADGAIDYSNEKVDHIIHVYVNADCGDQGKYKVSSAAGDFALFYIEEGGTVVCVNKKGKGNIERKKNNSNAVSRSLERRDDLASIITGISDYQVNNSGKTPFFAGGDVRKFIVDYIDDKCTSVKSGSATETDFESCGIEFTDPDKTVYKLKYVGSVDKDAGESAIEYTEFDHTIYAYSNARCGIKSGYVAAGTGERQVALFMVGEDGQTTYCEDNH